MKVVDAQLQLVKDSTGAITNLILLPGGTEMPGKKPSDACNSAASFRLSFARFACERSLLLFIAEECRRYQGFTFSQIKKARHQRDGRYLPLTLPR
jgi:hypothetical protein